MRVLFRFGLLLWALAAAAQEPLSTATLSIRLDEAGRQHALLFFPGDESVRIGPALAKALGCQPGDVSADRMEVKCQVPATRNGLSSTVRWPLSSLRGALLDSGAESLEIDISHNLHGSVRTTPPMESTRGMFGWTHQRTQTAAELLDVSLEVGFEPRHVWLLGCAAVGIALAPLLLAMFGGSVITLLAAVRVVALLIGTLWLWVVLITDAPAMVALAASDLPGPSVAWSMAAVAVPLLAALFLGYVVLRPMYEKLLPAARASLRCRLTLWSGVSAVGFLLVVIGLFRGGDNLAWWAVVGLIGLVGGSWRRLRTSRGSFETLKAGTLLARIHELAAKAGTSVKVVHLVLSGYDAPAAFAGRNQTILLTHALLRDLSREEVDSVIAHELSHIRRRHTMWISAMFMMLPLVFVCQLFVPDLVSWSPLLAVPGFLVFMAMRRRQERIADADAVRWTGGAEALIRALSRATRGNGTAFDWGGWVRFVLPHPPTMERFRLMAAASALPSGRIEELIASTQAPPQDAYELPPPAVPSTAVFNPRRRARLRLKLGALAIAFPPAYSVAVPLVARVDGVGPLVIATVALVCGMLLFYLAYEGIVGRSRAAVRRELKARLATQGVDAPGEFVGFAPSAELRVYSGMYDLEWGFVAFEADRLVFRGDHGTFSASRREIAKMWVHSGPASWTAKPMVSFELAAAGQHPARGFSMRPFDDAFGPSASQAARRLRDSATTWRSGSSSETHSFDGSPLADYPNPESEPNTAYPWTRLIKGWIQTAFFVVGGAGFLQISLGRNWDLSVMLTSLVVTAGMLVFAAWPALRR